MELTGLNCNGNPLNPLPGVGPKHADDMRRTIELAGAARGQQHRVTMSGTPGSDPDARYPSWVVNPWDGVYMDVLDYQWDVAAHVLDRDRRPGPAPTTCGWPSRCTRTTWCSPRSR